MRCKIDAKGIEKYACDCGVENQKKHTHKFNF
jgi:hypothetical protein